MSAVGKPKHRRVRPVPTQPGYFISSQGAVFSECNGAPRRRLKPMVRPKTGYATVNLFTAGRRRTRYVHHLVAEAFLPPRPTPAHELRHLDGNARNNTSSNLRWGTRKENAADKERHGRTPRGEKNGASMLTSAQVDEIRRLLARKRTVVFCAQTYGVSEGTIRKVRKGESWR